MSNYLHTYAGDHERNITLEKIGSSFKKKKNIIEAEILQSNVRELRRLITRLEYSFTCQRNSGNTRSARLISLKSY